jgi:hypothetical protein
MMTHRAAYWFALAVGHRRVIGRNVNSWIMGVKPKPRDITVQGHKVCPKPSDQALSARPAVAVGVLAANEICGRSSLIHHEGQAQASSEEGEVQNLRDNLEGEVFVGKAAPL